MNWNKTKTNKTNTFCGLIVFVLFVRSFGWRHCFHQQIDTEVFCAVICALAYLFCLFFFLSWEDVHAFPFFKKCMGLPSLSEVGEADKKEETVWGTSRWHFWNKTPQNLPNLKLSQGPISLWHPIRHMAFSSCSSSEVQYTRAYFYSLVGLDMLKGWEWCNSFPAVKVRHPRPAGMSPSSSLIKRHDTLDSHDIFGSTHLLWHLIFATSWYSFHWGSFWSFKSKVCFFSSLSTSAWRVVR